MMLFPPAGRYRYIRLFPSVYPEFVICFYAVMVLRYETVGLLLQPAKYILPDRSHEPDSQCPPMLHSSRFLQSPLTLPSSYFLHFSLSLLVVCMHSPLQPFPQRKHASRAWQTFRVEVQANTTASPACARVYLPRHCAMSPSHQSTHRLLLQQPSYLLNRPVPWPLIHA